jgi:hypothetical protein
MRFEDVVSREHYVMLQRNTRIWAKRNATSSSFKYEGRDTLLLLRKVAEIYFGHVS